MPVPLKKALEIIHDHYSGYYAYIEQETGVDGGVFRRAYEGKSNPEVPTINKIVKHAQKLIDDGEVEDYLITRTEKSDDSDEIVPKGKGRCENCKKVKDLSQFEKTPSTDPLSFCYKCRILSARAQVLKEEAIKDEKIEELKALKAQMAAMDAILDKHEELLQNLQNSLESTLLTVRRKKEEISR